MKRVLIEEIGTQDESTTNNEGNQMQVEEDQTQAPTQTNPIPKSMPSSIGAAKKDLLRLEKNYFDSIYNPEKHTSEKAFAVSKLLTSDQTVPNTKPVFKPFPKSDIKDRLNQFLPAFKSDTNDLLTNIARQEQLRIDDRNHYLVEEEEQEEKKKQKEIEGKMEDDSDEEEDEEEDDDDDSDEIEAEGDERLPKQIELDILIGMIGGGKKEKNQEVAAVQMNEESVMQEVVVKPKIQEL